MRRIEPLHHHDPDAAYLMDPALALSQRQRWEHTFHAELTHAFAWHDDPDALTAAVLPQWLSTRAERALERLTSSLPSWAGEFIRHRRLPENPDPQVMTAKASATEVADALAPTLATAAFAQHVLTLLAVRGVEGKRWVTRHDPRVRDSHREADGQVQRLSAPFVVGGALMQYPADARTAPIEQWINDRCVVIGAELR